ncbi:MAG TPA: hypothetical protein PKA13_14490 [Geminicoccaceae bacterium]|nr:hypothetical protein [Geminicoccus sp.]HMU50979.1 hypothetical protein [Geminicoccaceae bacterium]
MTARLVVALEPDEDDLALLEGYARLAAELRRELVALLVDDPGFGHALALPFVRLQPRMATAPGELGPGAARRALELFRARAERRLVEACRGLEVSWRLSVVAALPPPGVGDILVFGPRGAGAGLPKHAACPIVLRRRTGRSIAVVYEGTAETLELAATVARRERLPVAVLVVAEDAAVAARLAAEASAAFGADSLLPADRPLATLAALRPRAVVLDACNASLRLADVAAALA